MFSFTMKSVSINEREMDRQNIIRLKVGGLQIGRFSTREPTERTLRLYSQHVDVPQPLYGEPGPFGCDRIRCRAQPECMTALGKDSHVDRNADIVERQGISHGMPDIVD